MYKNTNKEQWFQRAYDSPQPWVESSSHLRTLGTVIQLPPRLRMKELGGTQYSAFGRNEAQKGHVPSRYVASTGKWELILDYVSDLPPDYATFVRGHEEGHVYQKTGNLLALLHETQRHGLEFEFFAEDTARLSDEWVKNFLALYPNAVPNHPWFRDGINDLGHIVDNILTLSSTLAENTADIAGVLALIKAEYDPELIRKVSEIINKQTSSQAFIRERLPDREVRAFWEDLYANTS